MNIMIIEDNEKKLKSVVTFLEKNFEDLNITHKSSINGSLLELKENNEKYDVILLDMNFPRYENENNIERNAGLEVLKRLFFYKIKVEKIIMISSDDVSNDVKDIQKYNIFNCQYGYQEFYENLLEILKK